MRYREDNPGEHAGMSWYALRLVREEPEQVLRLQAFRAAHPEVIIGDGGFEVWHARIPGPDSEHVISRYTLRELMDKLDELTGERRSQPTAARTERTALSFDADIVPGIAHLELLTSA